MSTQSTKEDQKKKETVEQEKSTPFAFALASELLLGKRNKENAANTIGVRG